MKNVLEWPQTYLELVQRYLRYPLKFAPPHQISIFVIQTCSQRVKVLRVGCLQLFQKSNRCFESLDYIIVKRGCVHFDLCILHAQLIDLDPYDTCCEVSPKAPFLFFSPEASAKVWRIWSWNLGAILRKVWTLIWHQNTTSGWVLENEKPMDFFFKG